MSNGATVRRCEGARVRPTVRLCDGSDCARFGLCDGSIVRVSHLAPNLGTVVPSHLAPSDAPSHRRTVEPSHQKQVFREAVELARMALALN